MDIPTLSSQSERAENSLHCFSIYKCRMSTIRAGNWEALETSWFERVYEVGRKSYALCKNRGELPYYFGGARSKGFATLRNVSKLQFFDKIGQAKSVGFRLYSAIWRSESRISPRYLEITSISLIYSLTFFLAFPGFEPTHLCDPSDQRRL